MEVKNENYRAAISVKKGAGDASAAAAGGGAGVVLGTVLVSSLRNAAIAPWDVGLDGAVIGLVATGLASAAAGVKRWWRNRKKYRTRTVFSPRSVGMVVGVIGSLALGLCAAAQDVLTVTETGGQIASVVYEWTSKTDGTAVGQTEDVLPGVLFSAHTAAGSGGSQPTNAYDVVIKQAFPAVGSGVNILATDLAGGSLADRSNTTPELVNFWPGTMQPVAGKLRIEVSNAGSENSGRIEVAVARHLAIRTVPISLGSGSSGQVLQWADATSGQWVTVSGDATLADGGALTIPASFISGRTAVTAADNDRLLIWDETDSTLKYALASDFFGGFTMSGGYDYIEKIGSSIHRNPINLATDVNGRVGYSNLPAVTQEARLLGRGRGVGSGDALELTPRMVNHLQQFPVTLTSTSNAVAWNGDDGKAFYHAMTENTTVGANSGTPYDGQRVTFRFLQSAGPYTLAFNSQFVAADGLNASIDAVTTTNGDMSIYGFEWVAAWSKYVLAPFSTWEAP